MAKVKMVVIAMVAFVIFDAALFDSTYTHQLGGAVARILDMDWQGI